MIPGLIVSGGLYMLLYRSVDLAAERRLVAAADAGLDDEPAPPGPAREAGSEQPVSR